MDPKKLREEAAALHAQGTAILNEYQGKTLPKDKSEQVDKLFDDVDAKIAQAGREERQLEQEKALREPKTGLPSPKAGEGKAGKEPDAETKAWRGYLVRGEKGLSGDERKALSASDDAAGGFLTAPQQFATDLLKFADDQVFIRQLARVEQITSAESLGVLSLDSDLSDWSWTTELATGAEDTVSPFGKRALTPHPLAKRVKISRTLIRKSAKPVEQIVQQRIAYKLGVTQEKGYLTGTGNQQPLGLFTADANGVPTSRDVTYTDTNDTTRSDSLIDAKFSLKSQYQAAPATRWIFHRDMVKRIRKYRDANNQFMYSPGLGLAADMPRGPQFLDVPIVMSEFAPNTFSSGAYIGLIGDLSFYWIVDALNMSLQVLNELYAETNQIGYIVRYEGDGAPMLAEAFARVKFA